MKYLLLLALFTSCVPATQQLPVKPQPAVYQAAQRDIHAAVLRVISDAPAVPSYNPGGANGYERAPSELWLLTSSDPARGLISARAESRASGFFGSNAEPDIHEVEVALSSVNEVQTRVSVSGTPQTERLAETIYAQLDAQFERP